MAGLVPPSAAPKANRTHAAVSTMTQQAPKISRFVSLGMLILLICVIGLLALLVLWGFVLPLFLAGMAAVLFQPLHQGLVKRFRGRIRLAAGTTTLILLLSVLLPLLAIGALAVSETASLIQSLDRDDLGRKFAALQNRLSLGPPKSEVVKALDDLDRLLDEIRELSRPEAGPPRRDYAELRHEITVASGIVERTLNIAPAEPKGPPAGGEPSKTGDAAATGGATPAAASAQGTPPVRLVESWKKFRQSVDAEKPPPTEAAAFRAAWENPEEPLAEFRTELYGGPFAQWFKRNIKLEPDVLQRTIERLRTTAGPLALGTTQYLAGAVVSLAVSLLVMLICVYYFLADGHNMIKAVTKLTPLDEKYVTQLFEEFGTLTRAIVLSMLLAAGAQGLLAGIGYYFTGVPHVFLLTILTVLFAMLPLVGATLVWGGAAIWLYVIEGHTGAAIGLTIYCVIVVSLADNLVKPLVLQGKSNLHPLPALLSILGGVSALGPIGVFVGPMVMALFHTLLVMLRNELKILEAV
jgi:predicted PurR-regulated permease PerM